MAPPVVPVQRPGSYTVKKGDTLYSIALDHGLDYKDLAAWNKIEAGLPATIVAGTELPNGALVLGDAGGRIAVSDDSGRDFKVVALKQSMPLTGVADVGNGRLALVGLRGVAVTELPAR